MGDMLNEMGKLAAELPEGFKMTELGPLPEDWNVIRLGDILSEVDVRVKDTNMENIPVLSITRHQGLVLQNDKFKKRVSSKDIRRYKVVKKGQIVYGFPMEEGVIFALERFDMGAVSPVYEVWEPNTELTDVKFLDYLLKTPAMIAVYERLTSKTVQRRRIVSRKDFKLIRVGLPPLSEQCAIARVLRTVQRAKEATERVIQATRELKKSLMRHLFTYGPVPVEEAERVPLKETEIGLVPEHWEVVKLGEVCQKPQYGFTASAVEYRVGPKFLRITDIQNDQVNWHTVPYCEINDTLLNKYRLEPGDVLFARIGATTGKTFLVSECPEAIFASYLIRVRVNTSRIIPEYLFYFTHGNVYWSQINAVKGGRLKQGINIPLLSSLIIPLPPLSEQHEIARILGTVNKKIQAEELRKQALDVLFKTLLHNLMTGKLRVKDLILPETGEGI